MDCVERFFHGFGGASSGLNMASPTLVKVSDGPVVEAEDMMEEVGLVSRSPQQRRGATQECCDRLAVQMEAVLHQLQIPHVHTCPDCGTVWRLEMRIHDTHHGW